MTLPIDSDQWVRDLLWVVNSPSLMHQPPPSSLDSAPSIDALPIGTPPVGELPVAPSFLEIDQIDPGQLAAYFAGQVPRRVGFYFERLVQFWLTHIRAVDMVAHSLQVRDGQRTVGEIDFLFRDEQGRLTHWEVAVKYYLHVPQHQIGGSHFVGPHLKDTFERKRDRIFDHQLPLSRSHFPDVEIRQAMVKGRIFYALDHPPVQQLPAAMTADHLRDRWIRQGNLAAIAQASESRFQILMKPYWLSDAALDESDQVAIDWSQLNDQIRETFSGSDHPVLVSRLCEQAGKWIEAERLFIVPDDWPNAQNMP